MPYLIEHIDKIAREKNRDVLFILFDRKIFPHFNCEDFPVRTKLLQWFNKNKIMVIPCADVASEHCLASYRGQVYIDVPFDENHPDYVKIRDYLENPDGSSRFSGVLFCYLPLEHAMKNKYHDEPGFWEKWAENF
ncbi:MAG: hypothetical protein V1844_26645 [Pseudomonadota bacterium]